MIREPNSVWQLFVRVFDWVADRFADAEQNVRGIPGRQVGFAALSCLALVLLFALFLLLLLPMALAEIPRLFRW